MKPTTDAPRLTYPWRGNPSAAAWRTFTLGDHEHYLLCDPEFVDWCASNHITLKVSFSRSPGHFSTIEIEPGRPIDQAKWAWLFMRDGEVMPLQVVRLTDTEIIGYNKEAVLVCELSPVPLPPVSPADAMMFVDRREVVLALVAAHWPPDQVEKFTDAELDALREARSWAAPEAQQNAGAAR